MAQERSARPPETQASRGQRLLAAPRAIFSWVRAKPLVRGPLAALSLAVVLALGAAWSLWRSPVEGEEGTLEEYLAAVNADDMERALMLGAGLVASSSEEKLPQGLALYARGRLIAREAHLRPDHESRREAHRLAAGLLQQALDQGLPEELWELAILETAENLNCAGRYAQTIRVLDAAVDSGLTPGPQIERPLAEAYSRTPNPDWAKALAYADRRLARNDLAPHEREAASLDRAEMLLGLNRDEEARRALDALAGSRNPLPTRLLVLRVRLALDEIERQRAPPGEPNGASPAENLLDQALMLIQEIQKRDAIDRPERRAADYLEGVVLRERGEYAAALDVFSAVHRLHFADPSGLAAGMNEGELLQHLDRHEDALDAFRRLLSETPTPAEYSNAWISLDGFRARLLAAYARWLGQQKFAEAIALARDLSPWFPPGRAMSLQGEARTEWAQREREAAEAAPFAERAEHEAAARKQFRLAGVAYARTAAMRQSSREFPDDIWRSAESYLRGHDFKHAARMFRLYLSQEVKPRRPDAQVYLGEALLSLGELDQALEMFAAALATDPQHPANYRARILAAQASHEKGDVEQAKASLRANLENESLAPQSLEWRDSLFLLGELLYREASALEAESRKLGVDGNDPEANQAGLDKLQRAYEACREATGFLSEAIQRYPSAPQTIRAWYFLAEAHREAAKYPRKRRASLALEVTRLSVEREMQADLTRAVEAYNRLIELLAGRERTEELANAGAGLTAIESAMLRNAYFGSADALFDLGRYDEAIRAYTLAANRYQNEPAALEAFVQIASCHRRMRRPGEAKGVLEQAKVVLARIGPEVDFERTTRYGRNQWDELLNLLTAEWR
jgi:tetratricopeptide (TPR) repeat protein